MLLLKRAVLTVFLFIVIVIAVPLTIALLRGGAEQKATGIGVLMTPEVLAGVFAALLVSAAISTLVIRD